MKNWLDFLPKGAQPYKPNVENLKKLNRKREATRVIKNEKPNYNNIEQMELF